MDIASTMLSPSKIQRSRESAEEDFTAFVESALSPLATGAYNQSADNSRDAPLLPMSQRSNFSQQQIPLSAPSSNEWSPNASQSGFGTSNGNEFKICFPDATSPGGFAGGHPRMRHKKKEGGGNGFSSSQDHLQNSRQTLAARLMKDGKFHGDDSSSLGGMGSVSSSQQSGALGGVPGVIGMGRDRSNSNGSFVGSSQHGAMIGAFPIMIPGYAQSTLELEEDSLGGAPAQSPHHLGGEMRIAHSPRKAQSDDMMGMGTNIASGGGMGSIGRVEKLGDGLSMAVASLPGPPSSGGRARRRTPKAAESRMGKSKASNKQASSFNSSSSFGSIFKSNYQDAKISCNCKKSRCLKLYCECFHALKYCNNCNCYDCENRPGNDDVREAVIATIKERNPDAFDSKIKSDETGNKGHLSGCHCKRSACLKKYCECFAMAVPCGIKCRCLKCQNTPSLYQMKDDNAAYTAHMLVSAAAATLEDTGEEYFSSQKSNEMASFGGSSTLAYGENGGDKSPTITLSVNEGVAVSINSPRKRVGMGLVPPSSPGASLLELAGACSEQQKSEDTAIGLLALSPQRSKSAPPSPERGGSQDSPLPAPNFG